MDAEIFRPERWEEELPMIRDKINAKWGYLPFNGGPRICIGSRSFPNIWRYRVTNTTLIVDFALTEAAYTVVRLLQEFPSIKLPEGETVELTGVEKQTMTLVVSITDGCCVDVR
jgi:hypothetical protein